MPAMVAYSRGAKLFELTNHLGNVMTTISDRAVQVPAAALDTVTYFLKPFSSSAGCTGRQQAYM